MQEDELRKHIESFYVKIRAGRDPKTGELHLQPTDFYDQMLALIQQYSKDYAQEQQKASERDSENRPVAVWEELILKAFGEEVGIGTNGIHIQPKF